MSEETYEHLEQLVHVRKWNRELLLTVLNEEDLKYITPKTNFQAQIEIQATLRLARVLCTSAYTDPEPDSKERKQIQVRQRVGIQKFQREIWKYLVYDKFHISGLDKGTIIHSRIGQIASFPLLRDLLAI